MSHLLSLWSPRQIPSITSHAFGNTIIPLALTLAPTQARVSALRLVHISRRADPSLAHDRKGCRSQCLATSSAEGCKVFESTSAELHARTMD
ncbi:hypothetical protein BDN71DRAFT_1442221 [Pleurotus eryngii]|uniref:Uncharacterized protein n=1 Tax=Pleurotus eryngii TaxID=5323 RepID=A0A9P6DIM3_PLEER|nr:hypothetical protein BDN71DRAFT_1442221 [Pleurotus eryngii]